MPKNKSKPKAAAAPKKEPEPIKAPEAIKKRKKIVIPKKPKAPDIIEIDAVYLIVNQVQVERIESTFKVCYEDSFIVRNILRDAGLPFKEIETTDVSVSYHVTPGPERETGTGTFEDLEELDDEILEDGQIFP